MNPSERADYLEQIDDLEGENADLRYRLEMKDILIEEITLLIAEEEDAT